MAYARYLIGVLVAAGVTFGLFLIMQSLVVADRVNIKDEGSIRLIDPLARQRDETVERERREPEPPPEPEAPPPDIELNLAQTDPGAISTAIEGAQVDVQTDIGSGGLAGPGDGEYLPIVKVEPPYPRRAAERGIEGTCLVEYTVTETGGTEDIQVIEEECPSVFRRASVQAAEKFKYKPRVINGEAIRTAGVRNLFTFQLADDGRRR